jgi:DNA mismatch repair protein MutS
MAGMPQIVILKAQKLKKLEKNHSSDVLNECRRKDEMQMSFFNLDDPLLEEIKRREFRYKYHNAVEALMKLNEIKRMLTRKTNLFVFKIGYQSLTLY